ncbi:MAG: hypothetical protein K1X53_01680 [Candidatus Sumerlaeaceae bacterium]|nr:hypothetical protein [Candidatus Sumerlaeaceae bacterium]
MKQRLLLAALLMAAVPFANAQTTAPLDVLVLKTGTDVDALNGGTNPGNAEFDGVAVIPNESAYFFFDSIGTNDGVFKGDASTTTVYATEAQISANTNASATDMDADASNVYIASFDSTSGKVNMWRSPHASFGTAVNMLDQVSTVAVNIDEIEVDAKNSRLLLSYGDTFAPATPENISYVPLTATAATPTILCTEAALEAQLATVTGYVDDTSDDINMFDMTCRSNGDIIVSQGFSSNRQVNGTLLKITETGTVSVFRTGDQIITAAGGNPAAVDIGSVNVEALSDGKILIHVQFTSSNAALLPFIAVVSADGASQRSLGTVTELGGDASVVSSGIIPSGQTLFFMDSKGGDVAAECEENESIPARGNRQICKRSL